MILAPGIHFCPLCCVKFIQLYYFISSSHPPQKFYPPKNAMTCKRKFFTFDVCETGQSWRTQGANNSFILVGKQVFKLSHSKGRCENGLTSCISLQKGSSMLVSSYPPLDPKMAKATFLLPGSQSLLEAFVDKVLRDCQSIQQLLTVFFLLSKPICIHITRKNVTGNKSWKAFQEESL